jgi:hypothetical protein
MIYNRLARKRVQVLTSNLTSSPGNTELISYIQFLEAALKPFAQMANEYDEFSFPDSKHCQSWLAIPTIKMLRDARSALLTKPKFNP